MYHHSKYNRFYYSNLCHVCKTPSNLRCSECKTVAYCSLSHQKQDRKLHKELCKAIAKTEAGSNYRVQSFKEFKNHNISKSLSWQKELCRLLYNFECQMWMFPRVCAVCFSKNVTIDCSKCLNVSYCTEMHKNDDKERHDKFCDALKLCMAIDLYYFNEKFLPTELNVFNFDTQIKVIPNDLRSLMFLYGENTKGNDSDEAIQFILKCNLVAPAATILYGMEKACLLNERLLCKSNLTVHIVGADCTELAFIWEILTELHFHWIKDLINLEFCLIGPDLNRNNVTETVFKQLCDTCKEKNCTANVTFHRKLYHEIVRNLNKPDIVVAFNSGLHELGQNNWGESITSLILHHDVPLLLTAYTLDEIELDIKSVRTASKSGVKIVLGPHENPFRNLTPIRDWETENSPVFYVNGYAAILKATR